MVEILRTGLSGLMAFQRSLATTGHNIANANTPNYSRQRVDLTSNSPWNAGSTSSARSAFIGTGVNIAGISRIYDDFLTQQVRNHDNNVQQLQTLDALTSQVSGLLGDSKTGLTPALQQFFSALQDVADTPDSLAARQALLSQGESLSARFRDMDHQLNGLRNSVNQGLQGSVKQINTLADAIGAANQEIIQIQGSTGAAPSDLLDQRDRLLAELSRQVAVQAVPQGDGALSVFIGAGQTLVQGHQASHLETVPSATDPHGLEIRYQGQTGSISGQLKGGQLGGYLTFSSQVLDPTQDSLGLLAMGLAETFNVQHHQGMDLSGHLGLDFFQAATPQVLANTRNAGNASLTATVSDIGQLQRSNYEVRYDGTHFNLQRLSDDQLIASNTTGSFVVDGLDISLAGGSPAAGDRFLIQPSRRGAADFSVKVADAGAIAAAAPLRSGINPANLGPATVSAGKVTDATDPKLYQAVEIRFTSPDLFDIVDATTGNPLLSNQAYTSGDPIAFNGWEVNISGHPLAGDRFNIASNAGGVGDNRNALALASLQSSQVLLNGTGSYQSVYAQLIAEVGTQGNRTKNTLESQQVLLEQASQAREAVSGVNLDEEAADLLRFQQSYEAAAQVIRIADSLFSTLLDVVRS